MTTTSPTLTPKQQKVRDLLKKGDSIDEIAKKLKISTSGVYAHKRNIEQLLGSDAFVGSNGSTPPAAAPEVPKPAASPELQEAWRGALAETREAADPAEVLKAAIATNEVRAAEVKTEIEKLTAEDAEITERLAKYNAALSALA
jgi:hypothetical protein